MVLIKRLLKTRRKRPIPVVLPLIIFAAASVGEHLVVVGVVDRATHLETRDKPIGNALGPNINGPAPEGGLPIGAVGLLHREGVNNKAWEEIERHHVPGEIHRGNGSPIYRGLAVALAQAPDIDELAIDQG